MLYPYSVLMTLTGLRILQLSVFQPRINEKCESIVLDLEITKSLTVIGNPFDQLLDFDTSKRNDSSSSWVSEIFRRLSYSNKVC